MGFSRLYVKMSLGKVLNPKLFQMTVVPVCVSVSGPCTAASATINVYKWMKADLCCKALWRVIKTTALYKCCPLNIYSASIKQWCVRNVGVLCNCLWSSSLEYLVWMGQTHVKCVFTITHHSSYATFLCESGIYQQCAVGNQCGKYLFKNPSFFSLIMLNLFCVITKLFCLFVYSAVLSYSRNWLFSRSPFTN